MAREFRFSALTTGGKSSSYAAVLKEPVQGLFAEPDDWDHWKPAASALLRLADDFVFLGFGHNIAKTKSEVYYTLETPKLLTSYR